MKGIFLLGFYLLASYLLNAQIPLTLLKDINTSPGQGGVNLREIVSMNGALYFAGDALWKSDGAPSGTTRVREIINNNGPVLPHQLTAGETKLFFLAESTDGFQLWASDGSPNGTYAIKSALENSYTRIDTIVTIKNTAFLFVRFGKKVELWQSDGTTGGTKVVKQITSNSDSSPWIKTKLIVLNENVYFSVYDEFGGASLWKTDGTEAGTLLVKESIRVAESIVFNNILFFSESSSSRFWRTDGTADGTILFTFTPGIGPYFCQNFTIAGNTLYFTSYDELWKTDGSAGGTVRIKTGLSNYSSFCAVGQYLYFANDDGVHGAELWRSDGTTAGTTMIYETYLGSYARPMQDLTDVNGQLFFAIGELDGLYKFNGTSATQVIGEGVHSPSVLVAFNNTLYFSAWRMKAGATTHYPELWRSDGTETGTYMVTNTGITTASSSPYNFTTISDRLYFNAGNENGWVLFSSDGTSEGTTYVGASGHLALPLGNTGTALFADNDELWKSDGTEAGSFLVKDIRPGIDGTSITNMVPVGALTYFTVDDGIVGTELWKTDGTTAGTVLVKDIRPGATSTSIRNIVDFKGELFFTADNGTQGDELWRTDGTDAGTMMVKDIASGSTGSGPRFFVVTDNFLYFSAYQPSIGYQLWRSDGTEGGTHMVKYIPKQIIWVYTSMNNIVYFAGSDNETGIELWRSDGSEAGTYLVKDIRPGAESSIGVSVQVLDGHLFFSADDGIHGDELWKSDGTEQGTVLVHDIYDGKYTSDIHSPQVMDNKLYFIARDDNHGYEVWKTDANDCGAQRVTDNLDIRPTQLSHIGQRLIVTAKSETYGEELYYYDISNNPPEKISQSITFEEPSEVRYGGIIELNASTASAKPVAFSSSNDAVASVDGNVLTVHDVGTVTITATHEGDQFYCPAAPIAHTIDVGKAFQSILFENIPGGTPGDELFLTATSSAGLPVSFSSVSNEISLSDNTIELIQPGKASVTAHQEGNEYYLPAVSVELSFCVAPPTPQISLANPEEYTLTSSNETGNQWYKDGIQIENETLKTLVVVNSGTYTVIASEEGCSSEVSDPLEVVILGTENELSDIMIFPNPFRDKLYIEGPLVSTEVQLFNALGLSKDYALDESAMVIDTKSLAPGIYFLKIRHKGGVAIKKLIKN